MVSALIDKQAVPQANTALYTATKDPDSCTYEGMKASFQEAASRVGEDGIFICHFTGHGLKIGDGRWGLAPSDFDFTEGKLLTSQDLNQWLHDSKCKARNVLLTLDCCYAGGIGDELTAGVTNLRPGLYVLSACTAFETSLVVGPLGQSLFAYFLAYAIRRIRFQRGTLPVSAIFDECGVLCTALSSLFMTYRGEHVGLKPGTMKPEFQFFDPVSSIGSDFGERVKTLLADTLAYSPVQPSPHHPAASKLSFAMKYYKRWSVRGLQRKELSELCLNWLIHISETESPLKDFACRGLLNHEILSAAICAILWSVASIQVAAEDLNSVVDPNIFLVGFVHAAAALNSFHSSQITLGHLEQAWHFYQTVVRRNELDDSALQELHSEITRDLRAQIEAEKVEELTRLQPVASLPQRPSPASDSGWTKSRTIGALPSLSSDTSSHPGENGWSLDIPELSMTSTVPSEDSGSTSIWPQTRRNNIMPSMTMESIRPILKDRCNVSPHHLQEDEVVADSIVLHVLQVSPCTPVQQRCH